MSDYRTYVTQTGFGLERDAKFNNTSVDFAVLVVGEGALPDAESPAAQTDLIHQVREYAITIEKDDKDSNVWIARAEIPAEDGGFTIREAGIKTGSGELYAYARQAGDYKPLLEEGQGKSYTIRLKFVPGNADTIQVKIDPSVQFATPTDLNNAFAAHVNKNDPHEQYQTTTAAETQAKAGKVYTDSLQSKKKVFTVSGTTNEIVLTSKEGTTPITELNDFDEFSFIVAATNTSSNVAIKIDALDAVPLSGISSSSQMFRTALLTVRYIGGAFYIADQVNPKTGNSVLDIAKLWTDTTDILRPGEYALDGSALSRSDHPIAFAIVSSSSNFIEQAIKDADPIEYGGYYGDGDGIDTFTLPVVGGEFIRMFDDGRGVDGGRVFGSWQISSHVVHDNDGQQAHTISSHSSAVVHGWEETQLKNYENHIVQSYVTASSQNIDFIGNETKFTSAAKVRNISFYGKTRL
jgi:phage-related tail fiber protein